MTAPDCGERRAHLERDLVALLVAVVLVDQVHLDVAHVVAAAQVVLPHQPVEIDRRRGARVHLVVGDLGSPRDLGREFVEHACGLLDRRALGHVEDDLELRLVVEGQHLHDHPLHDHEQHRDQDRGERAEVELVAVAARRIAAQQRRHEPLEEPVQARVVVRGAGVHGRTRHQAHRQPRRERQARSASEISMPMLALIGIGLM